ncbi:hypothetical protein ACOMHN_026940 [Nucella lapillus]
MTNPHDIKNKFYEEVDTLIAAVPQSEKLIVVGDFNARVERDHQTWRLNVSKLKSSKVAGECSSDLDGMLPDIPLDEQDSTEEQPDYSPRKIHPNMLVGKSRINTTKMQLPEKVEEFAKFLEDALSADHSHSSAAEKWDHLR